MNRERDQPRYVPDYEGTPVRYHVDRDCPAFPGEVRELTPEDERTGILACGRCAGGLTARALKEIGRTETEGDESNDSGGRLRGLFS